jgi:signal transduction histidine kinase
MTKTKPYSDAIRLIRFAAILWISYLVILAILNYFFSRHATIPLYYVLNTIVALIILALAYWTWLQKQLGKLFIPLIIALATFVPVINNWLVIRLSFPGPPQLPPEGPLLGMLPFVVIALLLVAWQYKWQFILLIILGITAINVATNWSLSELNPMPFQGALNGTLIQTVVFLAVGLSISYLMNRLGDQQRSLEKANVHLTHYASTLEHLTVSRERNRMARDLHDTLAHALSGLSVQLEAVKAYWDVDPEKARSVLEKSVESAHLGLEETRRALKALRASPLDDLGLTSALRKMIEDTASRAKLKLELSIPDNLPVYSPDIEQSVYRITQEAIANVVHHANAKKLIVKLLYSELKTMLTVRDDGVGFNLSEVSQSNHFGLSGIKERAQMIGGELSISTKPGEGTIIQLVI